MTSSDTEFLVRSFAALDQPELYHILQLRNAVFVLEQDCPYLDIDGLDQAALHVFKKTDTEGIKAYARVLTPAQNNQQYCSIGRVVVAENARHEKLGGALMQAAINVCVEQFPDHPLKISAQTYLTDFYQRLGFVSTNKFYLEDQIPHQEMLYQP